jgi:hypothetical protein
VNDDEDLVYKHAGSGNVLHPVEPINGANIRQLDGKLGRLE